MASQLQLVPRLRMAATILQLPHTHPRRAQCQAVLAQRKVQCYIVSAGKE